MKFKPTMYKKTINDIDYNLLKEKGIRCLIFDLDNTLALIDEDNCTKRNLPLIIKLKKEFDVFIISNNTSRRLKPFKETFEIDVIANALKPSVKGLKKIYQKGYKKSEMVMIGDQLVTDIYSANRFKIMSILVDPLGVKDLKITSLNRFIERKIVKSYESKDAFKKGRYYE